MISVKCFVYILSFSHNIYYILYQFDLRSGSISHSLVPPLAANQDSSHKSGVQVPTTSSDAEPHGGRMFEHRSSWRGFVGPKVISHLGAIDSPVNTDIYIFFVCLVTLLCRSLVAASTLSRRLKTFVTFLSDTDVGYTVVKSFVPCCGRGRRNILFLRVCMCRFGCWCTYHFLFDY